MARPAKTGLDYYPMDVGFLRDKKVKLLRAEFGASSVIFVLYVLGKVYEEEGYFLAWDQDELLMAADELRKAPSYISEVLRGCLSRSLFDERVFQASGVLTSPGIQRRYLRGCEKRDEIQINAEYWLLNLEDKKDVPAGIRNKVAFFGVSGEKTRFIPPKTPRYPPEIPKVKERKVKKRRVEKGGAPALWGEFRNVRLDPGQRRALERRFGQWETAQAIENFSAHCASAGKQYRDHYAALVKWLRQDRERAQQKGGVPASYQGGDTL